MSIIGEGGFGCVHKPSLECNTNQIVDYDDKVSKLLTKKEADKELKEYTILKNIDKDTKYYLGVPVKCIVKDNKENKNKIKQCKKSKVFLKNLNDMRILVMKDGGYNLSNVLENSKNKKNKKEIFENLLIYLLNVFDAIKLFVEKRVTHRDIKCENIVFDFEKKKIKIIDFGIMNTFLNLITKAKKSTCDYDIVHWSVAPYSIFINKNVYQYYQNNYMSPKDFNDFINKTEISSGKQMDHFYKKITINNLNSKQSIRKKLNNELYNTVSKLNTITHENFLEKVFSLLDVHGLGIALLTILGNSKSTLKNKDLVKELNELGIKMISFDVFNHITIHSALDKYKNILRKYKLPEKYNYKIENNYIVSKKSNVEVINISNKREKSVKSIMKKLQTNVINARVAKRVRFANKTQKITPSLSSTPSITKTTPPGKMLNLKTGRYINIPKTRKNIPKGKVLNPKTGRYINATTTRKTNTKTNLTNTTRNTNNRTIRLRKLIDAYENNKECPTGQVRNPLTGRCIKSNKTLKTSNSVKVCPPGKVINPITGRCVEEFSTRTTRYV